MDRQALGFTARVPRWVLPIVLVLGVAAMHTLGHLSHGRGHGTASGAIGHGTAPGHGRVHAPSVLPLAVAVDSGQEVSGLGGTLPRLDPSSVCLAVLPSFLLLLMATAMLRARRRRNTGAIGARPAARGGRSPPRRTALRLARLSVLRV
jgi:hypothetical protein